MRFLVQTIKGKLPYDFSFALQKCQEYYNWLGKERLMIKYAEIDDPAIISNPDWYIPVGSVEFVTRYLMDCYPQASDMLMPLNVPTCLFPFAKRKIANIYSPQQTIPFWGSQIFRKSNYILKAEDNGIVDDCTGSCVGYQFSEVVDIDSEWRVFVFKNEIQHIANYSGDCLRFPDKDVIQVMVQAMSETRWQTPVAYTLDVGVSDRGTFPIEVHRFFSCGLYGFADYKVLPKMLSQCWYQMINKYK